MAEAAIRSWDLTKHFGPVVALESVDLDVSQGEIFGFLGPNGSGKSTTIRLLLGLIHPTRGGASILGVPVGDVERAHRLVGYVPGDVSLWPRLTGTETLDLLANMAGHVDRAFRAELLDRFQLDPSPRVRSLSKGNRQKVALVAALMGRPDVLILDEPTVGLDPKSARLIKDILRQMADRGAAVMLSTHILEIAENMCDRIGIINKGKVIAAGTMDELRQLGAGESSLEDIFLSLTGGTEYAEIAEVLK